MAQSLHMFVSFALFACFAQSHSRFLNFLAQGLKVVPSGSLSLASSGS